MKPTTHSIPILAIVIFMVCAAGGFAEPYNPVQIEQVSCYVSAMPDSVTVAEKTFSSRLVVTIVGRNFHIRALDPVIKLGGRVADDFRISSDESSVEVYFYGSTELKDASSVSIMYPGETETVFPFTVPESVLMELN